MRWDEMRWSVECAVGSTKCRLAMRRSCSWIRTKIRTKHARTRLAGAGHLQVLTKKVLVRITLRQLPPRLVRVLLVRCIYIYMWFYIYDFIYRTSKKVQYGSWYTCSIFVYTNLAVHAFSLHRIFFLQCPSLIPLPLLGLRRCPEWIRMAPRNNGVSSVVTINLQQRVFRALRNCSGPATAKDCNGQEGICQFCWCRIKPQWCLDFSHSTLFNFTSK